MRVKFNAEAVIPLPWVAVEATITFGSGDECATISWNGPGGESPHCEGGIARLTCR